MRSHVLIIDDSLTVRMDLQEVFEGAGFATTMCPTVAAARAALVQELFHLIVLDVLLPDADGIEFLRELKASSTTADIPIMLLSWKLKCATVCVALLLVRTNTLVNRMSIRMSLHVCMN